MTVRSFHHSVASWHWWWLVRLKPDATTDNRGPREPATSGSQEAVLNTSQQEQMIADLQPFAGRGLERRDVLIPHIGWSGSCAEVSFLESLSVAPASTAARAIECGR